MSLPAGMQAPTRVNVLIAQPAAGTDWSLTIPATAGQTLGGLPGPLWVKLIAGTTTLTCSSTVANRRPGTILQDGGGVTRGRLEFEISGGDPRANFVTPVGYMSSHNWQFIGAISSTGQSMSLTIPRLVLFPGWTFGSVTPNLQATDQYSSIRLYLAVWTQQPFIDAFGPMWRPR